MAVAVIIAANIVIRACLIRRQPKKGGTISTKDVQVSKILFRRFTSRAASSLLPFQQHSQQVMHTQRTLTAAIDNGLSQRS